MGVKDESYLVVSNSLTQTGTINGKDYYRPTTISGQTGFEFFQDFQTPSSTRTITYDFTNRFTGAAQPVAQFSLSVFDIDSNYVGGQTGYIEYEYVDQFTIVGKTASGATVSPTITYKGTNITTTSPFSQTVRGSSVVCDNTVMDDKCQVSVTFSQPVVQVAVTYGNVAGLNYYDIGDDNRDGIRIGDPGDQAVSIRFDGYCYTPQPRLSLTKVLADNRIADTDQFTVQIKNGTTVVNDATKSTTTGTTNVVTTGTGTTGTYKIDPTKTYQLTEIAAGTTDLTKYAATYNCKKADGTTVTTLNPNSLNLTYGDNWTCTVTNSQRGYTFSGIVFNDNLGNVVATKTFPSGTTSIDLNSVSAGGIPVGGTATVTYTEVSTNNYDTTTRDPVVSSDKTTLTLTPTGTAAPKPITSTDMFNIKDMNLVKTQALDANCDGTEVPVNTAAITAEPSQCVIYRITATNNFATKALTNVVISDAASNWSAKATYVAGSGKDSASGTVTPPGTSVVSSTLSIPPTSTAWLQFAIKINQ